MAELLSHVINVVGPVLLCALVGYILALSKSPFDTKVIGALVSKVGYPTLIISHLSQHHVAFGSFLYFMGAAATVVALFGIIGFIFLRIMRLPYRAFLSPMMMNNVGNIGLPVCLLAFGDQGLTYALGFVVVVLVAIFTIGMWLPSGEMSLKSLVSQPVIYAVIIALYLMGSGMKLPGMVNQAMSILGGFAIPLMLITLGYTLATLNIGSMLRGTYLAAFHAVMAICVALVLVPVFGLTGTERGVFILLCLAPVSVATYLWISIYQEDYAADVAGMILVSTLLTIILLPLVLTFWI
ncbi:MAG: transporter [Hyphomicrobiales bacterium]|nr:transporter [Hyphomicrobiales bacterium]MCP4997278.1 transporter [Hyphomicrobiales bacterium]